MRPVFIDVSNVVFRNNRQSSSDTKNIDAKANA